MCRLWCIASYWPRGSWQDALMELQRLIDVARDDLGQVCTQWCVHCGVSTVLCRTSSELLSLLIVTRLWWSCGGWLTWLVMRSVSVNASWRWWREMWKAWRCSCSRKTRSSTAHVTLSGTWCRVNDAGFIVHIHVCATIYVSACHYFQTLISHMVV